MQKNYSYPIKTSFRVLNKAEQHKILKAKSPLIRGVHGHPLPVSQKTLGYVKAALKEDIGAGDKTSNLLIPKKRTGTAYVVTRQEGVFCGERLVREIFKMVDSSVRLKFFVRNGGRLKKDQRVFEMYGHMRSILKAERTIVNFIGRLSGISTATDAFVQKVKGYPVLILDTRKTTPLWRELEKKAVEVGGGRSHRVRLDQFVFVKENHRPYGDLRQLKKVPDNFEIEVRNFKELNEALKLNPHVILLDNFTPKSVKEAVRIVSGKSPKTILEASGNMNLGNIRRFAKAGVDTISIGSITHSVKAFDFSMLVY